MTIGYSQVERRVRAIRKALCGLLILLLTSCILCIVFKGQSITATNDATGGGRITNDGRQLLGTPEYGLTILPAKVAISIASIIAIGSIVVVTFLLRGLPEKNRKSSYSLRQMRKALLITLTIGFLLALANLTTSMVIHSRSGRYENELYFNDTIPFRYVEYYGPGSAYDPVSIDFESWVCSLYPYMGNSDYVSQAVCRHEAVGRYLQILPAVLLIPAIICAASIPKRYAPRVTREDGQQGYWKANEKHDLVSTTSSLIPRAYGIEEIHREDDAQRLMKDETEVAKMLI